MRIVSRSLDIGDSFFALASIANATANKIYKNIANLLDRYEIPYKQNLVGFTADEASTMTGHQSVKTLLGKDVPNIFVLKCLCYSLVLLPNEIENLVRKIYNYFKCSYKRQEHLKEFQGFVNAEPHKLLQPSPTLWMSVLCAITRILEHFQALKLYNIWKTKKKECEYM